MKPIGFLQVRLDRRQVYGVPVGVHELRGGLPHSMQRSSQIGSCHFRVGIGPELCCQLGAGGDASLEGTHGDDLRGRPCLEGHGLSIRRYDRERAMQPNREMARHEQIISVSVWSHAVTLIACASRLVRAASRTASVSLQGADDRVRVKIFGNRIQLCCNKRLWAQKGSPIQAPDDRSIPSRPRASKT